MKLRVAMVVATIFYWVVISTLSLVSFSNDIPEIKIPYIDKIVHFLFYIGLNFLLLTTLFVMNKDSWRYIIGVTLVAILYGVVIELIQPLTGRSCEVLDIVANSMGAISGVLLFIPIRRLIKSLITK
ncbi:MAG: VanZ family protein [Rikenellaceae bacterium]